MKYPRSQLRAFLDCINPRVSHCSTLAFLSTRKFAFTWEVHVLDQTSKRTQELPIAFTEASKTLYNYGLASYKLHFTNRKAAIPNTTSVCNFYYLFRRNGYNYVV